MEITSSKSSLHSQVRVPSTPKLLSKRETRSPREGACSQEISKKIKMEQNLLPHPHKLTLTPREETTDMFKYYFIF